MRVIRRHVDFDLAFEFGFEIFGLPPVGADIQIASMEFDAIGVFPTHIGETQDGVFGETKFFAAVITDFVTV